MLGDSDAVLGSVPQNAQIIHQNESQPQALGMERANTAMAPANAEAKAEAEQKGQNTANQVTISPQMAAGLEKMTGQKWDQTVGTKWNANVFTAIVTGMAQAKYHQDAQSGKIIIQGMKDTTSEDKTDKSIKARHEDVATHEEHADERAKTPKPKTPTPKDPTDQGRQLLDAITKAEKGGDDATKKSAIDNYNAFAGQHGLASYKTDDSSWMDTAKKAISGLSKWVNSEGKKSDTVTVHYKGSSGGTLTKKIKRSDLDAAKKAAPDLEVEGE